MQKYNQITARELYLYVKGTKPFMDKCSEIAMFNVHWREKLSMIRGLVKDAVGQYDADYGTKGSNIFSDLEIKSVINQVAKDLGVLREVC